MAASALAAAKAAGVSPHLVFPPRPSATPAQADEAQLDGHVSPLYSSEPAPMGLGYYGLSASSAGAVVPTLLNTTSVEGTVDANSTGIVGSDLYQAAPDSFGIQLNAVTTNVTLRGTGGYSFWTQNVVEFFPGSGEMHFISNVWNVSGDPLSTNVFYGHSANGTQVGTIFYYAEAAPLSNISYPFDLALYLNSTLTNDRNEISFTVGVAEGSGPMVYYPFDYVVFNSLRNGVTSDSAIQVSNYTANGYSYNPIGLTDDFELIFGGPGAGSQVDLSSADATLGLATWNNGSARYVSVPSAYSYGGETGETSTGASVAWSDNPAHAPADLSTYGTMTTGPSFLQGLWNASGPEGSVPVPMLVMPSNAFVIVTPLGGNPNFRTDEASVVPGVWCSELYLAPGQYRISAELGGYDEESETVNTNASSPGFFAYLGRGSAEINTPLWAISNAQLAAISATGGAGTPSNPYVLLGSGAGNTSLGSVFGLYNDYRFPVFPGVFVMDTNASLLIEDEPSITAATNTSQYPGPFLPGSNSLQVWFWNVSNVGIVNTTFTGGWFGQSAWYPTVFNSFNVVFYASAHNLIYRDTFATPSQALLLYQGAGANAPPTGSSGGNTIWGSTFTETMPTPCGSPSPGCATNGALLNYSLGLGLELAEGNDTIVNNAFATPTTAWEVTMDLYSGNAVDYTYNNWNLTNGETALPPLPNFSNYSFSGPNILGGANQSGNYWWDYGYPQMNPFNGALNPLGAGFLPYEERAVNWLYYIVPQSDCVPRLYQCGVYIYPGGDYSPLTTSSVGDEPVMVKFTEIGLTTGMVWGVSVSSPTLGLWPSDFTHTYSTISTVIGPPPMVGESAILWLPEGTYNLAPLYPGEVISGSTTFVVPSNLSSSSWVNVTVAYSSKPAPGYGFLTFHETGFSELGQFPPPPPWKVWVQVSPGVWEALSSSTSSSFGFVLSQGSYQYVAADIADGLMPRIPSGTVTLRSTTVVGVRYVPYAWPVSFVESGLSVLKIPTWSVIVTPVVTPPAHAKKVAGHSLTSVVEIGLPNGSYTYTVHPVPGYTIASAATGSLTVANGTAVVEIVFSPVQFAVTFTATNLPAGATSWWVNVTMTVGHRSISYNESSTGATITFNLTNGTYHYRIEKFVGYASKGVPKVVTVRGRSVDVTVTFRSTPTHGSMPAYGPAASRVA